jgi:hypothetical protein
MDKTEETVTISKTEYEDLLARDRFLTRLQDAGVDNWNGYDYALGEIDDE